MDANVECQLRRGAAPVAMMKKRERRGSFDEDQESQKTLLSSSPAGRVESYTAHYYTVCCPPAPRGPLLLLHAHSTHTLLRVALTPPASYLVLHRTALRNIPPHYTHRYAAPLRCTTAALRCPHLRHLTNTPQPCLAAMKGAANSSAAHNPSVEPSSNSFFVPKGSLLGTCQGGIQAESSMYGGSLRPFTNAFASAPPIPWNPGTQEPWNPGTLKSWTPETLNETPTPIT